VYTNLHISPGAACSPRKCVYVVGASASLLSPRKYNLGTLASGIIPGKLSSQCNVQGAQSMKHSNKQRKHNDEDRQGWCIMRGLYCCCSYSLHVFTNMSARRRDYGDWRGSHLFLMTPSFSSLHPSELMSRRCDMNVDKAPVACLAPVRFPPTQNPTQSTLLNGSASVYPRRFLNNDSDGSLSATIKQNGAAQRGRSPRASN
jgi:hypothetical protein